MKTALFSRREAVVGAVGALAVTAVRAEGTLTATEVVERIQKAVAIPWRAQTVDKIVLGEGNTQVTGIATTMMATLDQLKRAVAAGCNMVVTHETPVYLHQDQTDDIADDPTLEFKKNFVREHKMAVFHFHDHWHARHPDGIATGMMQQLEWTQNVLPDNPRRFRFDGVPLHKFVKQMETRLGARTIRVVGDPKLEVHTVAASWGYASRLPGIPLFRTPGLDVFVVGETREWELVEYAQDTVSRGEKKALVVLGHVASEQSGMKYCAEWMKGFVNEVPVKFVPAEEPFWTPDRLPHKA